MQTEPDLGALTPAASDPDADLAPELDRQIAEMPPRPRPRRMLVAAPIVLLVAGFGLQLVAWAVANPLAASPDEPAHFTKALGAAYGQWRGQPLIKVKPGMTAGDRFLAGTTSQFDLPLNRYIMRPSLACVVRDRVSAACQDDVPRPPQNGIWYTHVGTYQPFVYLPMGLAARTASDGELALRLARLADVAVCLALLGGAAFCAGTRWRLIGLLAAVTPMCLFMFASVTPNGPEIAGAVCFGAASLALVVGDQRRGTWIWWAVGGCVLALSKGLGPVWIAVHVVLAVLLVGPKAAARLAWSERRRAVPAVVAVAAAAVVSAWWDVAFMPHPRTDLGEVNGNIRPAVDQLPKLLREAIGLFGWLNAPLPRFLYVAGYALLVGL